MPEVLSAQNISGDLTLRSIMYRKALYLLPLALLATSCSNDNDEPDMPEGPAYELRTLTFEDADARFTPYDLDGINIATWSDLIDDTQYGGALLYGDFTSADYHWADAGNTMLGSSILDNGPFWNGGIVVSDYWLAVEEGLQYTDQLAVPTGSSDKAGHNGSRNFAVQNGYVDGESYKDKLPALAFTDGIERVIDHLYITNTSYTASVLRYGNAYTAAATAASWFKVIAIGYDAAGAETARMEFKLCQGTDIVSDWTRWDLSDLGEVAKVEFNIDGSDDLRGEWGLNTPAYFAIDDVAVRFPN